MRSRGLVHPVDSVRGYFCLYLRDMFTTNTPPKYYAANRRVLLSNVVLQHTARKVGGTHDLSTVLPFYVHQTQTQRS